MRKLIALTIIVMLLALTACQNNESAATATPIPPTAEESGETPAPVDEPATPIPPTTEDSDEAYPADDEADAPVPPTTEDSSEAYPADDEADAPVPPTTEESGEAYPADDEPAAVDPSTTEQTEENSDAAGSLPEELTAQLDTFLQEQVYSEGTAPETTAPGVILLVDTPDGRYLQAAGVASLEDQTPMQGDDRLEIGSNTKSFTIVLLMKLAEAGVLSLDDSLSAWLPEWADKIPNGNEMTLRQLAQHTSGIWDYGDPIIGQAVTNPVHLEDYHSPEQLVQYAIDNGTPDFKPGEEGHWNYSNTGYILLGMVIEAASGEKLGDLYQSQIFDPLGLESAVFIEDVPEPHEIVDGYYWTDDGHVLNTTKWNVSQGWAAGGLAMTAEDLLTYAKALSAGELFEDPDSLAQMLDFDPNGMDGFMPYGLGLMDFSQFNAPDYWGHEGQTAGFQTLWYTNPDTDTTVVGLSNSASYSAFSFIKVASMLSSEPGAETAADETAVDDKSLYVDEEGNYCAVVDPSFPKPEPVYDSKRPRDLSQFDVELDNHLQGRADALDNLLEGKTILEIQELLDRGTLTSRKLVIHYLDRIEGYDIDKINSVLEINPDVLEIAEALDAERQEGTVRGPMHGIPVLLKDNIATGDQLHTAAGSYALKDWQADRDAFLVQQLRDAGAIILGKANLSEWANWMDICMPNGFSTMGGQTTNPYGAYDVLGSSSGSAASVAANFTTVSVGSETQGSIIAPSKNNSVVGLKTSRGLVSRDYIIPLLPWQDVPGPIGRNVTDVAVLLSAMTGVDANDPATEEAADLAGTDFTQFLLPEAAGGLRVGIPVMSDEEIEQQLDDYGVAEDDRDEIRQSFQAKNDAMRSIGEGLTPFGIEIVEVASGDVPVGLEVAAALEYGFKEAINQFLADLGDQVPVASLEEIIALNNEDLANRAPYGQGHLEESQNPALTAEEYDQIKTGNQETAVSQLNALFEQYEIDVIISDTGNTYNPAGFPALTVPAGYDAAGQPTGIVFVGGFLAEPQLLAVGHAFEQAFPARVAPDLDATLALIEALGQP